MMVDGYCCCWKVSLDHLQWRPMMVDENQHAVDRWWWMGRGERESVDRVRAKSFVHGEVLVVEME